MGTTSIPCQENTRDRLDDIRGDDYRNWDAFLNAMADLWVQREELKKRAEDMNKPPFDIDDVKVAAKIGAAEAIEEAHR